MAERILIPLDGSRTGENALHYVEQLVSKLAPGEGVEVTLLQVVSPPTHRVATGGGTIQVSYTAEEMEQVKDKAMEYLDKAGEDLRSKGAIVNCKVVIGESGVSSADNIIKAEEEMNADLVAMSTHGRRGLSRWAFGSVTDKVLRGGSVPVLMVRVKKETTEA